VPEGSDRGFRMRNRATTGGGLRQDFVDVIHEEVGPGPVG
jgi:hypothetical protein